MSLFRSRFAKLETLVSTEAEKRTPEQLALAQAEMDNASADLILVPKRDGIKSAADLQNHIDKLETDARTAMAQAEKAQVALKELKGQRVLDDPKHTSDKGEGGDGNMAERSKEAKTAIAKAHEKPYTATAIRMLQD